MEVMCWQNFGEWNNSAVAESVWKDFYEADICVFL